MKKFLSVIVIIIILSSIFTLVSYAHSGRTDSQGGHYDRTTGEYHYHHGYPAHDHPGGDCRYTIDYEVSLEGDDNSGYYDKDEIDELIKGIKEEEKKGKEETKKLNRKLLFIMIIVFICGFAMTKFGGSKNKDGEETMVQSLGGALCLLAGLYLFGLFIAFILGGL